MKRIFFVSFFILLSMMCATSLFALRVGLEFGNPTAVVIIRPEPFDIKIGYIFADLMGTGNLNFLHISADYRIINSMHLIDFLSLFFGVGAYAQIYIASGDSTNESDADLYIGGRIPIGIQAFLLKGTLEVFLEVVPTVVFLPGIAFGGLQGFVGFTIKLPK
ncbi:MAG: DUF3996 domain-containing protein [Spirochaetales bacterium]|nr:DUF3996 domain-containing protein [Spirochaetales bacterium]